jgi:hypothetical protein
MAKSTNSSTNGTSFYNVTFKATVNQLINAFGEQAYECNTGEDKVNFEWDMETSEGDVFTIYDWKEYRMIDANEQIEWHIGAFSKLSSITAKEEILKALKNN